MRSKKCERNWQRHDHRTIKRFALLPVKCRLQDDKRITSEIRWLETVYIRQRYEPAMGWCYWYNKYFVTQAEYEEYSSEEAEFLAKGLI